MAEPKEHTISRSFSRKISLGNYGGVRYETADFFASHSDTIYYQDKKPTDKEIMKLSEQVYRRARAEVEESVEEYLAEMRSVAFGNELDQKKGENGVEYLDRLKKISERPMDKEMKVVALRKYQEQVEALGHEPTKELPF